MRRILLPLLLYLPFSSQAQQFDGVMRPASAGYSEAWLPTVAKSSHAANLIELRNGDILCFWFSGSAEGSSDVAIVVSRLNRGSETWTAPLVIDHEPGYSYQNPVPFETPSGELWLLHTAQPQTVGQADAKVLLVKSKDHGHTWSKPAVLFAKSGAFDRNPILIRPDGAWLLPMYYTPTSAITTGAESHYSVVELSRNEGKTWTECRVPESNGLVQPSLVKQGNGYVAFFRSRFADHIYRATSPDGCTWTAPKPTPLANNNASIQALTLQDGHIAIVFDDAHVEPITGKPATGPRVPLDVAISSDGGLTWSNERVIEAGRRATEDPVAYAAHVKQSSEYDEYSYPSILQAKDGMLYAAFTWRRETIKVVRFAPEWVEELQRK
ncbi:sialidase family protein [Silvibacterium sp.]|uniref:sialidase family protein n=1 Tax=Silvibacterium sp. TaxID=1964179 RepID=UPI0039E6BB3F